MQTHGLPCPIDDLLLDGRNRREAAKLAGIIPPVIVTDVDPKLAVHRSNNQNRDATPGQKAMATAMAFPEAKRGGDRKTDVFKSLQNDLNQSERNAISRARYVLRNNPIPDGEQYPQRCLAIMAGTLSLTEAFELTQADVKKREEEEAIRQANAAKLADVRVRYPDLAAPGYASHTKRQPDTGNLRYARPVAVKNQDYPHNHELSGVNFVLLDVFLTLRYAVFIEAIRSQQWKLTRLNKPQRFCKYTLKPSASGYATAN